MKHKTSEKAQGKKQSTKEASQKVAEAELAKLQQQLADLQKEKDELFAKLQRVGADLCKLPKAWRPKQIAEAIAYEKETFIKLLLPALDNFEHAVAGVQSGGDSDSVLDGFRIVYKYLLDTLKSHGVEQIEALNQKFDPAVHQAMMQKTNPDKEEGIVLEEFQKGYELNGRVIRPSKVVVNKLPLEQEADMDETADKE